MIMREFSRDFLVEELELHYSALEERIIETSRRLKTYEIVFEYEGNFYRTTYSTGATEMQDERPWECLKRVTCTEVELKDVIVKKWVPIGTRVHLRRWPYINILEGTHYISPGDYIITGVKGERYPCKPEIFHMTYEEVEA